MRADREADRGRGRARRGLRQQIGYETVVAGVTRDVCAMPDACNLPNERFVAMPCDAMRCDAMVAAR